MMYNTMYLALGVTRRGSRFGVKLVAYGYGTHVHTHTLTTRGGAVREREDHNFESRRGEEGNPVTSTYKPGPNLPSP